MPIAAGTRIGPYEIVDWLGAGGMGEVYRARDPRLSREVAIKLLPEVFAADPSRLRRFEQEACAAGQLDHPNILTVHDVGLYGGAPFLVSELLEGESLGALLRRGPLAPRRAVDVARQIAEGLAVAHAKGVVHRDLKPDNVFIGATGRVTILDFGLAKLTQATDDERPADGVTDTEAGTVLGTTGYMSPEQLRGEAIDARTDIFSFGAVLYQMLSGRPSFLRPTPAETMAAILKEDPPEPLSQVPVVLERIVARCLEKAREARFQSARDLAFGLEVLSVTTASGTSRGSWSGGAPVWLGPAALPWAVIAALSIGLAMVLFRWAPWTEELRPGPQRLRVDLGTDVPLAPLNFQFGDATSLSPDASAIAFVAQQGESGRPQIYVRRFSELEATPLSGTDDALAPFFSPDGQWIGFFASGKLKTIPVRGGAAVTLADALSTRGGAWGEDNTIVFAPNQVTGTRLQRVSASGGSVQPLTSLSDGEAIQLWPQFLPGGRAVLYTSSSTAAAYNDADLVVQMLPDGARKVVQRGGFHGRYVPATSGAFTRGTSGHLVYMHEGTLFAAPFDPDRLEVTGPALPALGGVASNSITGGAQFSVAANGTLAYLPGPMVGAGTPLHWANRDGTTVPLRHTLANWFNVRFSPDGQRIALNIREPQSDVWIYEWARDAMTRVTADPAEDRHPVWTPDGRRLTFASDRADRSIPQLYWQRADGAGDAQRLAASRFAQQPSSWHPSGRFLAYEEMSTNPLNVDILILPMTGDEISGWVPGTPTSLLHGPDVQAGPMFSPDGRWLAYASNESGRSEVYVRPFPGPGGKWVISTGGGHQPVWSPAANEIFYGINGQIMVAAVSVDGDSFRAGKPRPWSGQRYQTRGQNRMFDLHADSGRFALAPALPEGRPRESTSVILISNFFHEFPRVATPATR